MTGDAKTPVEKKLTDPRTNIATGTRYLRYLLDMFPGRLELALAAYNAGEGAVQRAGNQHPELPRDAELRQDGDAALRHAQAAHR